MKYITTTELRTKSSELVNDLRSGEPVGLIHRSEVIGTIEPSPQESTSPTPQALDQSRDRKA